MDEAEVFEKLSGMDSKLDDILRWKAVHQESHKTINRDLTEVRDTLFDNPGLKSQVQTLMNCKHGISRWRDFWMGVLKLVIVAALIAVISWFMVLYEKGGSSKIEINEPQTSKELFGKEENEY